LAQVLQRYHGEDVEAPEALDLMEAEKWMRNGSFKKKTAVDFASLIMILD
jgi:hypothetical protein